MTSGKSIARAYIETIVVATIVALFVRTFLFQAFKIHTGSMERNLLVGDHLLVNRFVLAPAPSRAERLLLPARHARRGDIVVFKFPEQPERDFVKRVVAIAGETVEVRAKRLYINGRPIDEPFVHFLEPPGAPRTADEQTAADVRERYGPVTVPPGHLFVMGDNRDNSEDSRYWGFLPERNVKGRAMLIYWSFAPDGERPGGRARWWLGDTRWERILRPAR